LVPQAADLTCGVQIELEYIDSGYTELPNLDQDDYCGVVGPVNRDLLLNVEAIPQISYATKFPADTFSMRSMLPSGNVLGSVMVQYLQRDVFRRESVSVIVDSGSAYGPALAKSMEKEASEWDLQLHVQEVAATGQLSDDTGELLDENGRIVQALAEMLRAGDRTIVVASDRPAWTTRLAHIASGGGLLEQDDFFWVLPGDALPHPPYRFAKPVDKLVTGAAIVTSYDRFIYQPEHIFLREWRNQQEYFAEELSGLAPTSNTQYTPDNRFFQVETPALYSSYLFDSIMSIGISACRALKTPQRNHVQQVLTSEFNGPSGEVSFYNEERKRYETSRRSKDVLFGVYNLQPSGSGVNGKQTFSSTLVALYSSEARYSFHFNDGDEVEGAGAWRNIPGEIFLFRDGTANEPSATRTVRNNHYLSNTIQLIGFGLVALVWALSLATCICVFVRSKSDIIKDSQPRCIYSVCLGASIMASAVLLVAFDEDNDAMTLERLSRMCQAAPWALGMGHLIMYAGLFTKLWQLRRFTVDRQYNVNYMLPPFAICWATSVVILAFWFFFDPMEWIRFIISSSPLETYGECDSENFWVYVSGLLVLSFFLMVCTSITAWRLREIRDARFLAPLIIVHIQVGAVVLPLLFVLDTVSKELDFLLFAGIVVFQSGSMVLVIAWNVLTNKESKTVTKFEVDDENNPDAKYVDPRPIPEPETGSRQGSRKSKGDRSGGSQSAGTKPPLHIHAQPEDVSEGIDGDGIAWHPSQRTPVKPEKEKLQPNTTEIPFNLGNSDISSRIQEIPIPETSESSRSPSGNQGNMMESMSLLDGPLTITSEGSSADEMEVVENPGIDVFEDEGSMEEENEYSQGLDDEVEELKASLKAAGIV